MHPRYEYHKAWRKANKDRVNKNQREYCARNREIMQKHKAKLGCSVCKNKDFRVLDFHHIAPEEKLFTIGSMKQRRSIKEMLKEASKCRILCANCHRIQRFEENK